MKPEEPASLTENKIIENRAKINGMHDRTVRLVLSTITAAYRIASEILLNKNSDGVDLSTFTPRDRTTLRISKARYGIAIIIRIIAAGPTLRKNEVESHLPRG